MGLFPEPNDQGFINRHWMSVDPNYFEVGESHPEFQ